jgi:hypothetical protein
VHGGSRSPSQRRTSVTFTKHDEDDDDVGAHRPCGSKSTTHLLAQLAAACWILKPRAMYRYHEGLRAATGRLCRFCRAYYSAHAAQWQRFVDGRQPLRSTDALCTCKRSRAFLQEVDFGDVNGSERSNASIDGLASACGCKPRSALDSVCRSIRKLSCEEQQHESACRCRFRGLERPASCQIRRPQRVSPQSHKRLILRARYAVRAVRPCSIETCVDSCVFACTLPHRNRCSSAADNQPAEVPKHYKLTAPLPCQRRSRSWSLHLSAIV